MQKVKEKQNIPEGWSQDKLGSCLDIQKGKLPRAFSEHEDGYVPYLSIKFFDGVEKRYSKKEDGLFATKDDLLVIGDGSGSGRIYRGYAGLVSSTFLKISSKNPKKISNNYLESVFKHLDFSRPKFRKGGAIPHFDFKQLKEVDVLLPPLIEQQKIAEVLGVVDDEIEKIKEVIKATEKLKKGLMQKLFTRGIGHTKFKETKIGEIPESWDTPLLDTVAKRGSGHTPSKKIEEYYNGGIKWISLADSNRLDKGEISETKIEISQKGIENSSATLHPQGTVLMSRDAGIGKSAVMAEDMAVSQHFITWMCGDNLNNWYLYYLLQSKKSEFERIAMGSTIKTIGVGYFQKLKIPLPSFSEQEKIAGILSAIDEKISVNKKLLAKQTELKKGLMQDLLSGVKRVKV